MNKTMAVMVMGLGLMLSQPMVNMGYAGSGHVAIEGHCPVCLTKGMVVKGSPKFSTEYKGKIYYFPSLEQQKAFVNDPEKYIQDLEAKYKQLKQKESGVKHEHKGSHY